MKYTIEDDWMNSLVSRKGDHSHFLLEIADLKDTSAELLVCTPDKDEVKSRIHSEETLIIPSSKLRDLLDIEDNIYEYKAVDFHWDLDTVLEERAGNMP